MLVNFSTSKAPNSSEGPTTVTTFVSWSRLFLPGKSAFPVDGDGLYNGKAKWSDIRNLGIPWYPKKLLKVYFW